MDRPKILIGLSPAVLLRITVLLVSKPKGSAFRQVCVILWQNISWPARRKGFVTKLVVEAPGAEGREAAGRPSPRRGAEWAEMLGPGAWVPALSQVT